MSDELVSFDEIKLQNQRLKSSLDSKIAKVPTAKPGNIAAFSGNGGLIDSGQNLVRPVRYGYKIDKNEPDPYARVEYIYDAVGFTPAAMNFETSTFNYGSWADVWFVKDNKPLMLKGDGSVDYYLNPNDYTLKEDGTASDVANTAYDGNAMAQFPLCWFKRYEDDDYVYEIVSNVQWDETYKAYAHTDAEGNIKDFFYWEMFETSTVGTKLRSLSGRTVVRSTLLSTATQYIVNNGANDPRTNGSGNGWYLGSWSQKECIRALCILLGKSTDASAVFGNGRCCSANSHVDATISVGQLIKQGQFFGYSSNTQFVKVFHVENFWGHQCHRVAGAYFANGTFYVKMTPEGAGYNVTGDLSNMINTGLTAKDGIQIGYVKGVAAGDFGFIPNDFSGSSTTYFPDYARLLTSGGPYIISFGGNAWDTKENTGMFRNNDLEFSYKDTGNGFAMSYI